MAVTKTDESTTAASTSSATGVQQTMLRHGRSVAGLVVVLALAFWLVGALRGGDAGTTVEVTGGPAVSEQDASGDGPAAADEQAGRSMAGAGAAADTPADPASRAAVSVQVLDGVHDDSSVAAQSLADRMRADDYDVVVVQRAVRPYEATVVMYTPGRQEAADQLAADYDLGTVEPKVASLSDEVDVHVVVGADQT